MELKSVLNFKQLEKLFKNYSVTSGVDVALYDLNGEEQLCVRKENSICNFLKSSACKEKIIYSGKKANELGSAYIYETPCGLIMCITPVVLEKEPIGYITSGPVCLWDNDEFFVDEVKKKCEKLGATFDCEKFDFTGIKQIDSEKMTSISEMLVTLVNYMVSEEKKYLEQRLELSRLNLERMKATREMQIREASQPRYNKYPIELEKELIAYVQLGDKNKAKSIINRFLNEIFSYASGDLDIIKAKLYEFCAFLSRSAVEAGAPISALTEIIKKNSKLLLDNSDYSDLCRGTVEILDDFLDVVYTSRGKKNTSEHLAKAIRYINAYYSEDINLETLAQEVFVSTYYLSHLFRREMGVTFSDYLAKVRVEKAKALLMEGVSVENTAEKVGYNDSNYFIKIFKKYVGITPAKYRKSIN